MSELTLFGFLTIEFSDLLDIGIVSFFFYYLFLLFRGSRAEQMLVGIGILGGIYFVAVLWDLKGVQWLFSQLFTVGVVAFVILFQPEIRGAFTRIGQSASKFSWRSLIFYPDDHHNMVEAIITSVKDMSEIHQGALIVIEGRVGLKTHIDTGVPLNADVEPELLKSLFFPKSPLHDGAVIISGKRIVAAACTLPIFGLKASDKKMGMRHRSAESLASESDAIVIVVSEETGKVSLIFRNKTTVCHTVDELDLLLQKTLGQKHEV